MNLNQLNILLADDDADDCLFFEEAITDLIEPAQFTAVHDGEQLMKLLKKETTKLPDILFLDLNMPRKNGFECLAEIKQDEKLKELPVVIFSTSFEQEVVNLLYENGAQYFIRKPAAFALFQKIILHTLTLITRSGKIKQPAPENFVLNVESSFTI
jgi:CheY-like chemotaxis protein